MPAPYAAGNGHLSHGLYRGLASDADVVLVQVRNDRQGITDEAIVRGLRWLDDPGNPDKRWDGRAGFNSVLFVPLSHL